MIDFCSCYRVIILLLERYTIIRWILQSSHNYLSGTTRYIPSDSHEQYHPENEACSNLGVGIVQIKIVYLDPITGVVLKWL